MTIACFVLYFIISFQSRTLTKCPTETPISMSCTLYKDGNPIVSLGPNDTGYELEEYSPDSCYNIYCETDDTPGGYHGESMPFIKFSGLPSGVHDAWQVPYWAAGSEGGCLDLAPSCSDLSVTIESWRNPSPEAKDTAEEEKYKCAAKQITCSERPITDGCLQDKAPDLDLVCTSDDVTLNSISASEAATCIAGQTVIVTLEGSITFANSVKDTFWYVATDAGDALEGICTTSYLTDGSAYDFTNDATVLFDDNVCGDVVVTDGGSTTLDSVQLVVDQAIQCVDDNGDGLVEVSVCFSWNDGSPGACGVPGSDTACACSTLQIPNLTVGQPPIKSCV